MPKMSQESASQVVDHGPAIDRIEQLGDYTVNYVTVRQDLDLAPLLKGLPDDSCQCPHWGYIFKGELTVRYRDHQEVIAAGEAFYLPPGHVPSALAGSEFLQFSPSAELASTEAAMMANMQAAIGS